MAVHLGDSTDRKLEVTPAGLCRVTRETAMPRVELGPAPGALS
jgi:hypothetical protein